MGREAAFELIVVLFMEVGIVKIKKSEARLYGCREVVVEVADGGADEVGAPGLDLVAEQRPDDPVELAIIHGGPESIFCSRMPAPGEKIEIGPEMIGEDQEPYLIGGADIQDAFEAKGAGC